MMVKSVRSIMLLFASKRILLSHHRYGHQLSSCSIRFKSSQTSRNANQFDEQQDEEFKGETKFSMPEKVSPEPIKSLELSKQIQKVVKTNSFIANLFIGNFDRDFLTWPILLSNRKDYLTLKSQCDLIARTWASMNKDQATLTALQFHKLHTLTISEMNKIFEAIGASIQSAMSSSKLVKEENLSLSTGGIMETSFTPKLTSSKHDSSGHNNNHAESLDQLESLFPLLIHNALSYQAISRSPNLSIKEKILNSNSEYKIGFAFCEPQDNLASLPYTQWDCLARLSNDSKSWVLNGTKKMIFHGDYDYYVIFCRTPDIEERKLLPSYKENEIIEDGVMAVVLPKDKVEVLDDGKDAFGFSYQRIRFENLMVSREEHELFPSRVNPNQTHNIKGIGQLATSAVILGMMKQSLKETYNYLMNDKISLSECSLVQDILLKVTQRIYSIESSLYLCSAMFDAFEADSDCYLEAQTVKTLATELAYESIHDLRSLYGARFLQSSFLHDIINVFDSFLDCSINNRMLLSMSGFKLSGMWKHPHVRRNRLGPLFPFYAISNYIKQQRQFKDNVKLDMDLCGFLHPSLKYSADWLEYCVKRLEFVTETLLVRHGQEISKDQINLNRVAQIAIDCFTMTSILSRASNAYCNGLKNADAEVEMAQGICLDSFLRVRTMVELILEETGCTNDHKGGIIHSRNVNHEGYFPSSTLDRII